MTSQWRQAGRRFITVTSVRGTWLQDDDLRMATALLRRLRGGPEGDWVQHALCYVRAGSHHAGHLRLAALDVTVSHAKSLADEGRVRERLGRIEVDAVDAIARQRQDMSVAERLNCCRQQRLVDAVQSPLASRPEDGSGSLVLCTWSDVPCCATLQKTEEDTQFISSSPAHRSALIA